MTLAPVTADGAADGSAHPVPPGASRVGTGPVGELGLAVEVGALAAFAFTRPVLDSFGRSPDTFVARGADARMVVAFGLAVTLVPLAALGLVGALGRLFGPTVRWWVHMTLVAIVGGLATWRLGQDITGWPGDATKIILAGALGGSLLAALRWRVPSTGLFLRYAGVASVLFLALFLFTSPASSLIVGGHADIEGGVTRLVGTALGDDAPPIVFIVADTFPTQVLLDGAGHIDTELYPNLAALADTATWYRNSTTVSTFTNEAVPALLSGLYPKPSPDHQFVVPYPHNLFTLFAGTYDLHVHEPVTRLCPPDYCEKNSAGLGALLGDAVDTWVEAAGHETAELDIPGLFESDRYADLESWIDAQDFREGGRPDLFFYHVMLPHEPFHFLPDGTLYAASDPPTGMWLDGWSERGTTVARQRFVMQTQATDRLLGRLFDRMREADVFDDALIVVAGDHGEAFLPSEPHRAVTATNYDQVMWATLIIKAPGQSAGEINDTNVETIDVLPTIADTLGFELPWDVDGLVAGGGHGRDPAVKVLDDVTANRLRAQDGEPRLEIDARAGFAKVLAADTGSGTGPDAVWQRTAHRDLVGRAVGNLEVGAPADGRVDVLELGKFADVDTGDPLPLEVVGRTADHPDGTVVAYALNDRIAAVVTVEPAGFGLGAVHGMLLPRTFTDGLNELTAYVVTGQVGHEVLHPIELHPLS